MFDKNNLPKICPKFYKDLNEEKQKYLEEFNNKVISKNEYDEKIKNLEEIKTLALEQKVRKTEENKSKKEGDVVIGVNSLELNNDLVLDEYQIDAIDSFTVKETTGVPMHSLCCEHCGRALYYTPIKIVMGSIRLFPCDFKPADDDVKPTGSNKKAKCPTCNLVTGLCLGN